MTSTSALMGRRPIEIEAPLHPLRRGAVLDALDQPQAECRAEIVRRDGDGGRGAAVLGERRDVERLQRADAGGGEVARDAADAEAVRPVGGHTDLDHRIADVRPLHVRGADGGVLGQIDDAVVILRQAHLTLRQHHAAALDAADGADRQVDAGAGNVRPRGREHADEAGARVRGAAYHLHRRAIARVHQEDTKTVGVGVLLGIDDAGDAERSEGGGAVYHALDLEADRSQLINDGV